MITWLGDGEGYDQGAVFRRQSGFSRPETNPPPSSDFARAYLDDQGWDVQASVPEMKAIMHSLQIRMTIAFTLAIGAATLASLAVEPSSKDRGSDARKATTSREASQVAAPRDAMPPAALKQVTSNNGGPVQAGLVIARDGRIRFDPQMIDSLRVGDRLDLGLQPRVAPEQFEVIQFSLTSESGRWWQLRSLDRDLVVATLAQRDGLVAGWMQEPGNDGGMEWALVPIGPGLVRPEPKAADLPGCGGGIVPDVGAEGPLDEGGIAGGGPDETECAGCAATVADIAFFYTSLCLEAEEERIENDGGDPEDAPAAIGAVCELECANTTIAMGNSGLIYGTRPVYVGLVEWDEQSDSLLGPFQNPSDGVIDEVHTIRDEVGADACALVSLTDGENPDLSYCGLAYVVGGNNEAFAFSSLVRGCMGYSLLAHEFGHNIGLLHAVGDGDEDFPCEPWDPAWVGCCAPGESPEVNEDEREYQHGWRWVGSTTFCFKTVMAYSPGSTVLNYSNPEVIYDGVATGSPQESDDNRVANNARRVSETMPGTAAYRCAVPEQTGADGRLVAAGLQPFDSFGISITTNGTRMMAGASRHDARGLNAGAAFVFEDLLDDEPDVGWLQSAKMTPTYLREGDRFGESVAASGDFLVVGSPRAGRWVTEIDKKTGEEFDVLEAASAGEVSVWEWTGAYYCLLQRLQPEELVDNDWFGHSVAIADGFLVIGAPRRDVDVDQNDETGAVYVYQLTGGIFEQLPAEDGFLSGDDPGDLAGWSVAVGAEAASSVRYAMIGAPEADMGRGKVIPYVFLDGTDALRRSDLGSSDPEGKFGWSMAMNGADAVIGAPYASEAEGAAVAYRVVANDFESVEELSSPGSMPGDRFGYAVAVSGDYIAVGAPDSSQGAVDLIGSVFIYERDGADWDWQQFIQPVGLRAGDRFGESAAIVGNIVFAGAPQAGDSGILSGVVYAIQIEFTDCNENLVDDSIDIYLGDSEDLDGNGIPDECADGSCFADLNGDLMVNGEDFGILLVQWGPAGPQATADLNLDGVVDAADLGLMLALWNQTCEDEP